MELIKTIRDSDVDGGCPDVPVQQERGASHAVVFDIQRKVALLYASRKNYHKLPGGGIEKGEDVMAALRRELLEKIGCSVKNILELGMIEEYRNRWALHQISWCFLADVDGEKGEPYFEKDEVEDGFVPVWVDIDEAIKILEDEAPVKDYEGKFIQLRDLTFLKEAKKRL